jgi:pseudouridine kinase
MSGHVLVIGAAGMDVKAMPTREVDWNTDNVGKVRNSVGGVARNIAENLARLEVPVALITAVGRDITGTQVIKHTREGGVRCAYIRRIEGEVTGNFVALLTPERDLHVAVSDFSIMEYVDAAYLEQNRRLFATAAMIVIDLNLSDEALAKIFEIAGEYKVRVCADPTSPTLAPRLCPYIDRLFLVTPNAAETSALCGVEHRAYDHDTALEAARTLTGMGADIAVVTMGDAGVAYADGSRSGYIRAAKTSIVDSTGAGDAFTGGVIFGLLNGVPIDEAMRLGVTAASLTLQTTETVVPNLTQELLYARLVV